MSQPTFCPDGWPKPPCEDTNNPPSKCKWYVKETKECSYPEIRKVR